MSTSATHKLPVYPSHHFGVARIEAPDEPVYATLLNGKLLVDRRDFIKYGIESRSRLDRMVNLNLLTPYHPNGTPKERSGGKYPSGRTLYDVNEWKAIDMNEL